MLRPHLREDLGTGMDINSALENIRKNNKISTKENLGDMKLRCSELLDQKEKVKLQ
jgi:hypothetical protein